MRWIADAYAAGSVRRQVSRVKCSRLVRCAADTISDGLQEQAGHMCEVRYMFRLESDQIGNSLSLKGAQGALGDAGRQSSDHR